MEKKNSLSPIFSNHPRELIRGKMLFQQDLNSVPLYCSIPFKINKSGYSICFQAWRMIISLSCFPLIYSASVTSGAEWSIRASPCEGKSMVHCWSFGPGAYCVTFLKWKMNAWRNKTQKGGMRHSGSPDMNSPLHLITTTTRTQRTVGPGTTRLWETRTGRGGFSNRARRFRNYN